MIVAYFMFFVKSSLVSYGSWFVVHRKESTTPPTSSWAKCNEVERSPLQANPSFGDASANASVFALQATDGQAGW